MEDRLALLAHELRSPVAALVAIAATIAQDGQTLEAATRRRLLELALAAGRDVERIVLDVSPVSLRLQQVDAARLVRDVVTSTRLGGASIRADAEGTVPEVRADPVRLRQALANLIENALAHSPAGVDVVVSARERENGVELAVADKGEGIDRKRHDAVFESGIRFADRPGQGLGLAIARTIAEAHGGRLEVEAAPGRGATFRLVLPSGSGVG